MWDTPVVYPIKIFVVCLHELAHALAALLTGGQVASIQIFPDEGGLTTTYGGWPFVIGSAGYLGSMLLGGALLYLSNRREWAQRLMLMLAVLIALSTLLFFRNFFAVLYGLLAAAAMFFSAYRLSGDVNFYIVRFIAVASCLYVLLDIRSDLFAASPAGQRIVNDAVALSRLTGLPAILWAVLWMAVSLIVLALVLNASVRPQDRERSRGHID
jgi:membrane-associated HD superfamily phosphohydrolase